VWRNEPGFDEWAASVRGALHAVGEGQVEKVVLARRVTTRLPSPPRLHRLLRALAGRSPHSRLFLVEPRPGVAVLGATPELLVSRRDRLVRTVAVAGSRARGRTTEQDDALARALLASSKDAWEHELVCRYLRNALARRPYPWTTPVERRVLKLPHVQHIETRFEGPSGPEESVLSLAGQLHPTPAVGGEPRDAALALLGRLEPHPRGWYAGPIGWFDAAGDGELAVGIRSATVRGRDVVLEAGCGIVEGSDPAEEWAESRLKFQMLLDAFESEALA
jgi:menaquinone-specific isochorismate synthase